MISQIIGTRAGNAPVPISILDFVMAGQGVTARDAVAASVELARLVDRRGFTRYWVAEHHSMPGVTTSSPPMLLARLAGETRRIRLGSGGLMLPNFPPLVVAEQFGLLAAMAPGRVDLGIGRAPGTDMTTAAALRRGQIGAEDFPNQLMELLAFLDADFPAGSPYGGRVNAVPGPWQDSENDLPRSTPRPPVWLLGSSGYSAQLVTGAMAVVRWALRRGAPQNPWLERMLERKPPLVAAFALANKMARGIWAMLTRGEGYRDPVIASAA